MSQRRRAPVPDPEVTAMAREKADWTNWSGTVRGVPDRLVSPLTEEQVSEIVRDRRARMCGVGVVGAGHSYAALVSPGGRILIDLRNHRGITAVDRESMTVTVKAGTSLRELNQQLAREGLVLPNQSAIDEQTVAGAVATATHGSSPGMGSLSSHVVAVRLVTADGEIRTITVGDPELDAARVHLGCLGVVTALTFDVVPAFALRKTVVRRPLSRVLGELDELRAASYGGFWWYPHTSQAVVWRADPTDEPATPLRGSTRTLPLPAGSSAWPPMAAGMANYAAALVEGRAESRVLRCDEALLSDVPPYQLQGLEYSVPVARAADAVSELARTVRTHALHIDAPVDIRFTAADSAWLSPSYQRATCHIGVTCRVSPSRPGAWAEPLAVVDALLSGHEGRPHWGKVHFQTPDKLAGSYPQWHRFQELRRDWDPENIFLGDHLKGLFNQ